MHQQECAHNLVFPLAVFTPFTIQHVLDLRWFICALTCPYHLFNLPCSISSFTTITTNMNTSHTSNPTTDVLASDLMGPILSMTLAGSQHVPTPHALWSPAERALAMPVKPRRLTNPESIESVLNHPCCTYQCLNTLSLEQASALRHKYASCNEHERSVMIITIMSTSFSPSSSRMDLRLFGHSVCS